MRFSTFPSVLILILAGITQGADIPVGSPISEQFFELSRELYGRGLLKGIEYSAPEMTEASDGSFEHALIEKFNLMTGDLGSWGTTPRLTTGLWLVENARLGDENKSYPKAFPFLKVAFGRRFAANVLYRIDGELADDPRYEGKSWKGVAGLAENATINFEDGPFAARFGIERLSWGHGAYGNLMFSRQATPLTVLGITYRKWILEFHSIIGFLYPLADQLDRMKNDTSFFTSQQRYLSAHSLTIRPFGGLSVSFREVVLYGGPGRRLEPAYAFPLIWYHGEQLNSRLDDNTMIGMAADYRFNGRVWAYSEILVDDYQIDQKTRGDYEPDQLGYLGGFELYDLPIERSGVAAEYARVNNWTYNQARAHNRYINSNFAIGFPDGPDVDIISWRFWHWPVDFLRVSYLGSYRRRGEGNIDTPWSRPWLDTDHYSESFPTGTVEYRVASSIEATVLLKNGYWGNLRFDFTDIDNVENIPGSSEKIWEIRVNIGLKLPPFSREL